MPERASLDELLEFANKVRAAGGGNPIDALMPAVPEDGKQCLIAKNLNFNCKVLGHNSSEAPAVFNDGGDWSMYVEDADVAARIAEAIGSKVLGPGVYDSSLEIPLPYSIGQVAADFDDAGVHLTELGDGATAGDYTDEQREIMREMWPLITESQKEAYALASIVNEDGTIVI